MDVARSGKDRTFGRVLGGEAGVVALDGSAGRRDCGCAGGKMQGHVGFDFERRAKFDGRSGRTWSSELWRRVCRLRQARHLPTRAEQMKTEALAVPWHKAVCRTYS